MPYLIDRHRGLLLKEIIAILSHRERRVRSHVVLRDNSLYRTLTRTRTFVRHERTLQTGMAQIGAKRLRRSKGAPWRNQP